MAFILDYLKENEQTPYADVRAAAEKEGHQIYPIMYGRAKALLGLIDEDSPRRRRARKAAAAAEDGGGGPRLRQGASGAPEGHAAAAQLSSFLERYRELEEERNRYRAALLHVEKLLRQTLESLDR